MRAQKVITLLASMVLWLSGAAVAGAARPPGQAGEPISIIFMHHSTGGNLIAQGGVREGFTALGYAFWDHGYNDEGLTDPEGNNTGANWAVPNDNTDPDGWYNIFNQPVTDPPANTFSHMLTHDVIIFKSCFPSSNIYDEEMFEAYRRYFLSMRDVMDQHPDKLFIPFTTPPLTPNETEPTNAARARRWAGYLTSPEYLAGHPNIAVFDFFSQLADADGYLRAEYRADEWDSHPNELANQTVGPIFVAFVDEAIRNFIPGAVAPEPEAETAPPAVEARAVIDDFEDGDVAEWWSWVDEGGTLTCAASQPGYESEHALQLALDTPPGAYGGCGRAVEAAGWGEAAGVRFLWRTDAPGLGFAVVLMAEETPFVAAFEATDVEWSPVTLTWDRFTKPDWAGDEGVDTLDPAQVTEINFDVGDWEAAQRGMIWIDDLQLVADEIAGDARPVNPVGVSQPGDKFALWSNETQLRGANIWQRVVVPDLDGPDFLGSGHVGPPYTQEDFDRLAALGANYVNLSGPGLFTERPPYTLDEGVQANLDGLLEMAAKADLFAVITFRTGPGRSDFTFYRDGAGDWFDPALLIESVWTDQAAQDAWVEMWRYAAARYRDNLVVVGYDLMCEPNAESVALEIWEPDVFYRDYAGTLYDWNQLYPRLVAAIRAVDPDTPILVGAMGWSNARWLPYLEPTGDARTVYTIHQYAPHEYTHQEPPAPNAYPGAFDLDWDGAPDPFDRAWLDGYLGVIDDFKAQHGAPVAVNEFGVARWVPGAAVFMDDQMSLFEARGVNYALWVFNTSWPPHQGNDEFDFQHGPDPDHHANVETSDLIDVIRAHWSRNTARPPNREQ